MWQQGSLALALCLVTTLGHAECPGASDSFRPSWTEGKASEAGYYSGVGLADRKDVSLAQQTETAKQAALRDLAGSIETEVRNTISINETTKSRTDGTLENSAIQFASQTDTTVSALVREVEVVGAWTDPGTCTIYVRVRAPDNAVRLAKVRRLLELALAGDVAVNRREKALSEAVSMAPGVNYGAVRSGETAAFISELSEKARQAVAAARATFDNAAATMQKATALLQEARSASGLSAQAQLSSQALGALSGVAASIGYGQGPDFWPETATWQMAEYQRLSGNPCEAKKLLRDLASRSADSWKEKAQGQEAGLSCDDSQRQTQAWRRIAFGKKIDLHCVYSLAGQYHTWERACADLSAMLTANGALSVDSKSATDPAASGRTIQKCMSGCSAASSGTTVAAMAAGTMNSRNNPQNPMGKDYQFNGKISALVLSNGAIEFADNYSGVMGWNPVSADMALDVLAIQSGKRFATRLAEQISK